MRNGERQVDRIEPAAGQSAFNLYFREYTEVADGKRGQEQKHLDRSPDAASEKGGDTVIAAL